MYNIAIRQEYGPFRGTYTNIAKTAIASIYFQCYNPISYSGHPRGSKKYRLAKIWGGGCTRVISGPRPSITYYLCLLRAPVINSETKEENQTKRASFIGNRLYKVNNVIYIGIIL